MTETPVQLTFLLLLGALLVVRMRWHIRAQVLEPGIANPSEGRSVPFIRWVVLPAWVVCIALWIVAPEAIGWALVPLPAVVRWGGAGVVLAGLVLLEWVHRALDTNFSPKLRIRADHAMITHGPYRWVRHPMYTSFLMLMGGYFLLSGHLLILVSGVGMVISILWLRTRREEAMLLSHFGAPYRAYMGRTGALLPRWRRANT